MFKLTLGHAGFTYLILMLVGFQFVYKINALTCYVCGTDESLTCDNFDPMNINFIKNCSSTSKSCIRVVEGNKVSRSCETTKINDCQTANGVEYCYCLKDKCNGELLLTTDDEDLLEGSEGSGSHKINPAFAITTVKPKVNHASILNVNCIHFKSVIILLCILNSIISKVYLQY